MARAPRRPGRPGEVRLNTAVVGRVLRSQAVANAVEEVANAVREVADEGAPGSFHTVRVFQGRDRVRAHVATDNEAAQRAELMTRNLSRAAHAARRRL